MSYDLQLIWSIDEGLNSLFHSRLEMWPSKLILGRELASGGLPDEEMVFCLPLTSRSAH